MIFVYTNKNKQRVFITVFLLFCCCFCFILNLGTSNDLSLASFGQLIIDFLITLLLAVIILKKNLGYSSIIQLRFYNTYLLSLIICLLLLHYTWTPFLSYNNPLWGFDPQRYYCYAFDLIKSGDSNFALNYVGIVYIYMFIMKILGADPLIPLFINSLLILLSVTFLSNIITKNHKSLNIKYFSWLILFPEFIYYAIMPSREIICMFAVAIIVGCYIKIQNRYSLLNLLIILFGILLLAIVRLPFAFITICTIFILLLKQHHKIYNVITIFFCLLIIIGGNYLSEQMGSVSDTNAIGDSLQDKINNSQRSAEYHYSDNSIAATLIPSNFIEFVIFGFIRSLCYLLPNPTTISQVLNLPNAYFIGDYFFVNLSSLILFFSIPLIFMVIKQRKKWNFLYPIIAFLLAYLFIIGTTNTTLIHVRYRIVYDLLFISLIPIAFASYSKSILTNSIKKWIIVSIVIVSIFIVLKN